MAVNLPTVTEFDLHPRETTPARYEKYVNRLGNLFVAMDITDPARQKAMFLHYVGEEVCDVHDTWTITAPTGDEGVSTVYDLTVTAVTDYLEPQRCTDLHVYSFRKEAQRGSESITEFHTRLQILAKKCEFQDSVVEIRRQIIQGTTNSRLRRKAIEQGLTLEQLLRTALAMETADDQSNEMNRETANAAQYDRKHHHNKPFHPGYKSKPETHHNTKYPGRGGGGRNQYQKTKCGLCGGEYPHEGKCPAHGKVCHNCGLLNHFTSVCRGKPSSSGQIKPVDKSKSSRHRASAVETENSSDSENSTAITCDLSDDDEYTFRLTDTTNMTVNDKPLFRINISGTPLEIMADSGASVNVLNEKDYHAVKDKPKLIHSNSRVYPYMSPKPLNLLGKFQADVSNGQFHCRETFFVVDGPSSSLLSWKALQKLNLITVANNLTDQKPEPDILREFPTVITGMGTCTCEPVKVMIDESIKPVAQPHRRIPFHVRKQVEQKLHELEEADIIERAEA
jgi:hypothetical protein